MNSWNAILKDVLISPQITQLKQFVKGERDSGKKIYPESKNVFRAFDECPFNDVKVVIVGQDPYHTPGTADGLAFSTKQSQRPKTQEIIFKEIYKDLNIQEFHCMTFEEYFPTNDLTKWAHNGFLLLNTALTVEEGKPNSHQGKGYELIIEKAIRSLVELNDRQIVFLFWGSEAKKYERLIKGKHVFFSASHPSAELYKSKAGFLGCKHFSIVRDILPAMNRNGPVSIDLTHKFDKEKAKQQVRDIYPELANDICKYIDDRLIIHVPVNPLSYEADLKEFELSFSTKY